MHRGIDSKGTVRDDIPRGGAISQTLSILLAENGRGLVKIRHAAYVFATGRRLLGRFHGPRAGAVYSPFSVPARP